MTKWKNDERDFFDLDELIEEIVVDAYGVGEQLSAFQQEIEDNADLPADAHVIGEPVSVIEIDYEANERVGLTAACLRDDGSKHLVAFWEVVFPEGTSGARYVAAYRRWLGLDPFPVASQLPSGAKRQHKAAAEDLDMTQPVELVVLSVKSNNARCRLRPGQKVITLRSGRLWDIVPGHILTVLPGKQWRYGGHPYLSGEIEAVRIDAAALGLRPLRLENMGLWDPSEYFDEENEFPIQEWAKPIIARGPRPEYEMEQVIPGEDPDHPFSDPITKAVELKNDADRESAQKILTDLLRTDLRCIDAHAHLAAFVFEQSPQMAIRHYEAGLSIGELSLGDDFDGLLPWGYIDNRPFLRCLHGYGMCLWRLDREDEAERVFNRMLWLNPLDNQGARFLLVDIRTGKAWEDIITE